MTAPGQIPYTEPVRLQRRRPQRLLYLGLLLSVACGPDETPHRPPATPLVGSLRLELDFEGEGSPQARCEAAGIDRIEAAAGGKPLKRTCETLDSILFEGLTEGVYPASIALYRGQKLLDSKRQEVHIEPGQTAQLRFGFDLREKPQKPGHLRLLWKVEGQRAATGCAAVQAETLRLTARAGSIDPEVKASLPCATGLLLLSPMRPGSYSFDLALLDSAGETRLRRHLDVRVMPGPETTEAAIDFKAPAAKPSHQLEVRWKLGDQPAQNACADPVYQTHLRLERPRSYGEPVGSFPLGEAKKACREGKHRFDSLFFDPGARVQLTAGISGALGAPVSELPSVLVTLSQTSTITVFWLDFPAL